MSEKQTPGYEVYKISERVWGVVYRINSSTSFDQKFRFKTRRAAISCAAAFNREAAEEREAASARSDWDW